MSGRTSLLARGVALFTYSAAQMIVDVAGWYLGKPDPSTLPVPTNPSFGPTTAVGVVAPVARTSSSAKPAPMRRAPSDSRRSRSGRCVRKELPE